MLAQDRKFGRDIRPTYFLKIYCLLGSFYSVLSCDSEVKYNVNT